MDLCERELDHSASKMRDLQVYQTTCVVPKSTHLCQPHIPSSNSGKAYNLECVINNKYLFDLYSGPTTSLAEPFVQNLLQSSRLQQQRMKVIAGPFKFSTPWDCTDQPPIKAALPVPETTLSAEGSRGSVVGKCVVQ